VYSSLEQQYQRIKGELITGLMLLGGVFLIGTLWYRFMEGWSWLDAAYMSVITLTTVGFSEVNSLGDRGRLFTIALIGMGVISLGYIVNRFTQAVIEGYFQEGIRLRQRQRLMDSLANHYIICGFGRTGRQIALEFQAEGVTYIVTDSNPEMVHKAQKLGHLAVQGDATLDETLFKVGIERSLCLVASLGSDAENLYIVLSAKALNPTVRAIARAGTEEAVQKLQRAGADAVVSPYITGGRRMAAAALRPQVMDFVDGVLSGAGRTFYVEEFKLNAACTCLGQTLRQARLRDQSGALILAIQRADDMMIVGPTADTQLHLGDLVISMGTAKQLRQLNQILSPIQGPALRIPKHSPDKGR